MEFELISLQSFIEKSPNTKDFEGFKEKVQEYLANFESQKNQNEPAIVPNVLAPFLQGLGFKTHSSYKQKGNSEIDLALLKDNQVEVIIEAKEPDSKDFFSKENPNCKALHQCILYYLREREKGNINLNFIIITNFYEFYVFRAAEFKRYFYKNKSIDNLYKILNQKGSQVENQTEFYIELSNILSKDFRGDREENLFNITLKGTYFDLRNALQSTTHNAKQDSAPNPAQSTKQDDTELKIIAHILSKAFLHNEIQKDTNALNKGFYNELLHILGLEEFKQNNKTLIKFDTQKNSFATMIYKKLKDSPHNKSDEEAEESTMSHIIIWLNRVLFLKLIEANLLSFNDNNESLRFLTSKKITRFSQLSHLFFEVLAKDYTQRGEDRGFAFLPYLNSSLFMYDEAKEPLKISELDSDLCIELFTTSILKKQGELESSTHSMKFLSYLFDFLASYDFGKSPQNKENKEQETKELINSSVLGSVFEKLNGYKEGSFYTPSFITSYMCKEALQKIVCEKFNAKFGYKIQNLKELRTQIDRNFAQHENDFKALLKSIKICDPAVGSGHFLVSALNEMIYIYHALGLLGFAYKDFSLKSDEIHIITKDSKPFIYKRSDDENHQIEQKLFALKKDIIENNLFGVDINPNSCEIARLRLWIELLKHSYYVDFTDKHTHKLETLPNIDINIKCGNSLVSYFGINQSLTHYPNIKQKMQEYKNIVKDYKEGFYENKMQIDSKIKDLLETFRNFCFKDKFKKEVKAFEVKCENYSAKYGNYLAKDDKNLAVFVSQRMFVDDFDESEALKAFGALKKSFDELFNLNSNKPFEWRFAFPEVLDDEGNFVGFDLVIGNPPYGVELSKEEREKYKNIYKTSNTDTAALFILFSDKILAPNGINAFIVPKALTFASNWEEIRNLLYDDFSHIIDCGRAWSYVLLEMIIFLRQKQIPTKTYLNAFLNKDGALQNIFTIEKTQCKTFGFYLNDLEKEKLDLGLKIKKNNQFSLADCGENIWGDVFYSHIKSSEDDFIVLGGKEIQRYFINGEKGYISKEIKTSNKANIKNNSVLVQRLIAHIEKPYPHIKMTGTIPLGINLSRYKIVNTIHQIICNKDISNRYILGLLHSKFLNWYCYYFVFAKAIRSFQLSNEMAKRIPIPKINKQNQKLVNQIIALVDEILKSKAKDTKADTSPLENQIDNLVYKLYNLTKEEVKIIEG
ncbi:MAG: class I SAM-dependent DNA methyltransferase [Helicobacter sp.]|nr:class I SAM-dependent DNA methyltransferase [Helicobacter sp.]